MPIIFIKYKINNIQDLSERQQAIPPRYVKYKVKFRQQARNLHSQGRAINKQLLLFINYLLFKQ